MYEVSTGFEESSNLLHEGDGLLLVQADADGLFSQTHLPKLSNNHYPQQNQHEVAISAMEMELQNQLNCEMEQQIVQEMSCFNGDYDVQNGNFTSQNPMNNNFPFPQYYSSSSNNLLPNSFSNSAHQKPSSFLASLGLLGDLNDPLLPLNLGPQPPLLRDLFHHPLPSRSNNGSLFSGADERDIGSVGALYENGVFEFTAAGGENRLDGKDTNKHYTTERHRRVLFNEKYDALRKLVANPTKNDRASIVGDAIEYINELKRSVAELKLLVEKKRCVREKLKRLKTDPDSNEGNVSKALVVDTDHPCNNGDSTLRTSWLHRKSKNTEVDVRIIDDEVTVKLVQQKRINCLLFVSKVLDELQLDLHHVAGGLIGDYYSFLFNSKICEGSIVYASAIANKLIEVVDKYYAAIPPTNIY